MLAIGCQSDCSPRCSSKSKQQLGERLSARRSVLSQELNGKQISELVFARCNIDLANKWVCTNHDLY